MTTTTTPSIAAVCEVTGADPTTVQHVADECAELLPRLRAIRAELAPLVERAVAVLHLDYGIDQDDPLVDELHELVDRVTGRTEVHGAVHLVGDLVPNEL